MCELNKNRNQVTFTSSIVAYSLAYLRKTYGNSLSFLYTSAVIKRVLWEQHNICICKYVEFDDEMQSASACHKAEWTSLPYLGRTTSGALTECVSVLCIFICERGAISKLLITLMNMQHTRHFLIAISPREPGFLLASLFFIHLFLDCASSCGRP